MELIEIRIMLIRSGVRKGVRSGVSKYFFQIKRKFICRKNEVGSAAFEFISLLVLLILPVITYFTLSTVKGEQTIREKRIFREISAIMRSGTNFQESFNLAKRFLTLESPESSLNVSCLSGECPHRESVMRIRLTTATSTFVATIRGGKWY